MGTLSHAWMGFTQPCWRLAAKHWCSVESTRTWKRWGEAPKHLVLWKWLLLKTGLMTGKRQDVN